MENFAWRTKLIRVLADFFYSSKLGSRLLNFIFSWFLAKNSCVCFLDRCRHRLEGGRNIWVWVPRRGTSNPLHKISCVRHSYPSPSLPPLPLPLLHISSVTRTDYLSVKRHVQRKSFPSTLAQSISSVAAHSCFVFLIYYFFNLLQWQRINIRAIMSFCETRLFP